MFSAGEIAKSIHAVTQCIQTMRSNSSNSSSNNNDDATQSNQRNSTAALLGGSALNGAVSGMGGVLSHQQAPNVSVVSSSMDFYGAPESIYLPPQPPNNNVNHTTYEDTSLTRKKPYIQMASGSNKNGIDYHNDASEFASNKSSTIRKKMKHSTTEEKSNSSDAFNSAARTNPDLSFEQAAIVAVLASLYGSSTNTTTSTSAKNDTAGKVVTKNKPRAAPSRLPAKQLQHVSRAVMGTSGGRAVTGSSEFSQSKGKATTGNGLGPRPVFPQTPAAAAAAAASGMYFNVGAAANFMMTDAAAKSFAKAAPSKIAKEKLAKIGPNVNSKQSSLELKKQAPKKKAQLDFHEKKYYTAKAPLVMTPSQYDVLLGRGKSNKNHPGNKRFQGKFIIFV
jgi:hypothetical protein